MKNQIFKVSISDKHKIILHNILQKQFLLIYSKSFKGCYDQNIVFSIRSAQC